MLRSCRRWWSRVAGFWDYLLSASDRLVPAWTDLPDLLRRTQQQGRRRQRLPFRLEMELLEARVLMSSQPAVQFTATDFRFHEQAGTATLTLNLTQPYFLPVSVHYATTDNTGHAASDYTAASGTLTFNPGVLSQSFTVPLLEDGGHGHDNEIVNLSLSDPTNATLGTDAAAALTILENPGNGHERATTTTLISSVNPADFGQPLTLTAQVGPAHGHGAPSGTVHFFDGSNALGVGAIDDSGQATLSLVFLVSGSHSLTAVYDGDPRFEDSTSAALDQQIGEDPPQGTSTSLSISPSPATYGVNVTFTATLSPAGGYFMFGVPSGSVTFKEGSTTLGTGSVTSGGSGPQATYSRSTLLGGTHSSITAVYGGDSNYTGSTSGASSLTVNTASSSTAISSSASPVLLGQLVTFTAAVTSGAGGAADPSGTVTFKDGSTVIGTGTLSGSGANDKATFGTTTLTVGTHSISANYGGDGNYGTSSATMSQGINNPVPTVASVSPNTAVEGGGNVTLTVTGTNFVSGAVVKVAGGSNLSTTFVSSSQLTATLASGSITQDGPLSILVNNPTPGGGDSGSATFTVSDALLSFSTAPPNISGTAGSSVSWTVTVTDADPAPTLGDFTATLKWGDGRATSAGVALSGSTVTLTGSHTYDLSGSYPIKVFVYDAGGSTLVGAATATIAASSAWDAQVWVYTTDPGQGYTTLLGPDPFSPVSGHVLYNVPLATTNSPVAPMCPCQQWSGNNGTSSSSGSVGTASFAGSANGASGTSGSGSVSTASAANPANPTTNLVYNSATVNVQPIVQATLTSDGSGSVPTTIQAQLTWNSVAQGWVTFATTGHAAGDKYLLPLQLSSAVASTDNYSYSVEIKATLPDTTVIDRTASGTTPVVANGASDPLGSGLGLSGIDQVQAVSGGVMWVSGTGQERFFANGPVSNTYVTPNNDFGALVKNIDNSFTYTTKDQGKYQFNTSGQLTRVTDSHSVGPTYTYSAGKLTGIQEPDGGTTTFNYTSSLLSSVQEPGGRTVTLTHSGNDLTGVAMPDGSLRTFAYDASHRMTSDQQGQATATFAYSGSNGLLSSATGGGGSSFSVTPAAAQGLVSGGSPAKQAGDAVVVVTDGLSQTTTLTLDGQGRVTQRKTPDGATQSFGLDLYGQATTVTDGLGRVTTYAYDYAAGNADLTQVTYPDGSTDQFQYDPVFHHVTQHQDTRGNKTTMTYDKTTGDLLTVTNALNQVTTYTWSAGLLQTVTDSLGHTITYQYDGSRRLQDVVDALNHKTTLGYDSSGNLATVQDALGHTTTTGYDGMNRRTTITDAAGGVVTLTYDFRGQVASATDQLGRVSSYTYDARGDLTAVTEAVGTSLQRTTTFTFDADGRKTSTTDGNGHVTSLTYDAAGRLKTVTSPVSGVTTLAYDLAGELTAATDALNHTTSFGYSNRGWVTTQTDALNQVTTVTYDTEGNVTSVKDARGNTTTSTFDVLNRLDHTTNALNGVASVVYDAVGNVVNTIDQLGHKVTFAYDAVNERVSVTDPLGNVVTAIYDAAGNVTGTIDQRGNAATFTYDALNRRVTTRDALNDVSTITYDAASNVLAVTNARGYTTSFAYDALNRRAQTTNALNGVATVVYDAASNVVNTIDELGHKVTLTYDATNRLVTTTDALGNVSTAIYDTAGNVTGTINPLGFHATMTYDAANRRLATTDPLNHTVTVSYDAVGNVLTVTDPLNHTASYSYDALNRRTTTTDALNGVATLVYDAAGNVTAAIDQRGNTTSFTYDADNRAVKRTDALNHTSTTVYDQAGNVVQQIDALGNTSTFSLDALNREATFQPAAGGLSTNAYDAVGNLVNTIDALGNKVTNVYDALDRQTQTIDPRSGTTTTVYDAVGNVVNLIDAVGNKTTFVLDAVNRMVQQTDALAHTASAAYDAAGRLTSVTDRDGRVRNFSYDNAGRLTGETWVVSGTTVNTLTFTYDARNDLLTAADANGPYTMTYDALNRVATQQELFGVTLTMTYDTASNRTVLQDSFGGVATGVYDAANRLTSVQFGGAGQTPVRADFAYSARDQLTGITRYSNLAGTTTVATSNFTYDAGGRLTNLQHLNPTPANIANYTFAYDTASRITSETRNGTAKTFVYDTTSQVTNDGTATYTYDLAGNRTMSGYTTGTGNKLTSDGTWNYTYDNEGNLLTKTNIATGEKWTYGYDLNNRMTSAVDATSTGTTLATAYNAYDVFGNRIEEDAWTQSSGTTTVTRFVYDGSKVLADLNGSNQLQTRYVSAGPAGEAPLARISSGGTVAWYLADEQGSVRDLVDNTGTVQDHLDYDAFGNVLTETVLTFGDRFKFQGMQLDTATGLYITWGRDYDPSTGRWTTQDPLSFGAGDANLYRFVSNDPTRYNDPRGLAGLPALPPGFPGFTTPIYGGTGQIGWSNPGNGQRLTWDGDSPHGPHFDWQGAKDSRGLDMKVRVKRDGKGLDKKDQEKLDDYREREERMREAKRKREDPPPVQWSIPEIPPEARGAISLGLLVGIGIVTISIVGEGVPLLQPVATLGVVAGIAMIVTPDQAQAAPPFDPLKLPHGRIESRPRSPVCP